MEETKQTVYLLKNIEEYGKFMAFCIDNDISVFRTYWQEIFKGEIAYHIDWKTKRCYYLAIKHMTPDDEYNVVRPIFTFNKYGKIEITHQHEDKGE
jgi:hypothetical protein